MKRKQMIIVIFVVPLIIKRNVNLEVASYLITTYPSVSLKFSSVIAHYFFFCFFALW